MFNLDFRHSGQTHNQHPTPNPTTLQQDIRTADVPLDKFQQELTCSIKESQQVSLSVRPLQNGTGVNPLGDESAEENSEWEMWSDAKSRTKKLLDQIEGDFDFVINNGFKRQLLSSTTMDQLDSTRPSNFGHEREPPLDDDASVTSETKIAEFYSEISSLSIKFKRSVPVDHLNAIFLIGQNGAKKSPLVNPEREPIGSFEGANKPKLGLGPQLHFESEFQHKSHNMHQQKLAQSQTLDGNGDSNNDQIITPSIPNRVELDNRSTPNLFFAKRDSDCLSRLPVSQYEVLQSPINQSKTKNFSSIENKRGEAATDHSFARPSFILSGLLPTNSDFSDPTHQVHPGYHTDPLNHSPPSSDRYYVETVESIVRTGVIKFYDDKNGYGFLLAEDEPSLGEIFVHKRNLQKGKICLKLVRMVKERALIRVRFQVARYCHKKRESRKAVNLTLVEFLTTQSSKA
jgi:hypothetical protein